MTRFEKLKEKLTLQQLAEYIAAIGCQYCPLYVNGEFLCDNSPKNSCYDTLVDYLSDEVPPVS